MANFHEVGPHDPVPLSEAVRLFFPLGGVTVSALRTEARKGRLAVERIAGKDFVTRTAIERMRELCRVERREQGSTYANAGGERPSGLSATDRAKQALAAAKQTAAELKRRSRRRSDAG